MSVNPPSFAEYLNDKARIKKLEAEIAALNELVESLQKQLDKKPEPDKAKLVDLLVKGNCAEKAAKLSGYSKSTADRLRRHLVESGAIPERTSKKADVLRLIELGVKDREIGRRLNLSCGYVRNIKSESRAK